MPQCKTAPAKVRGAERERQALALRKAGVTFTGIASELGVSRAAAHNAVMRGLKRLAEEGHADAKELRALEEARLDVAMVAIAPEVKKGNLAAIDRWVRISERRARLRGLDAPMKHAPTNPEGTESYQALSPEEIAARVNAILGNDDADC